MTPLLPDALRTISIISSVVPAHCSRACHLRPPRAHLLRAQPYSKWMSMADTTRKPPEGRLIPAAWAPWAPYHQGHRGTRDAASEPRFPSYDVADLVSSIINICRPRALKWCWKNSLRTMRRRTRTSNWQPASKTPTNVCARPVLSVDPSHLGLTMTSPQLFDAPWRAATPCFPRAPPRTEPTSLRAMRTWTVTAQFLQEGSDMGEHLTRTQPTDECRPRQSGPVNDFSTARGEHVHGCP